MNKAMLTLAVVCLVMLIIPIPAAAQQPTRVIGNVYNSARVSYSSDGEEHSLRLVLDNLKTQAPGFEYVLAPGTDEQILDHTKLKVIYPAQSLGNVIRHLFSALRPAHIRHSFMGETLVIHDARQEIREPEVVVPETRHPTTRRAENVAASVDPYMRRAEPGMVPAAYLPQPPPGHDLVNRFTLDMMIQGLAKAPLTFQEPWKESLHTLAVNHATNMAYYSHYGYTLSPATAYGQYYSVYPGYWSGGYGIQHAREVRSFQGEEYFASFKIDGPNRFLDQVRVYVNGKFSDQGNNLNNRWNGRLPLTSGEDATIAFVTRLEGQDACFTETVRPLPMAAHLTVNRGDYDTPKFPVTEQRFYTADSRGRNKALLGIWDQATGTCVYTNSR